MFLVCLLHAFPFKKIRHDKFGFYCVNWLTCIDLGLNLSYDFRCTRKSITKISFFSTSKTKSVFFIKKKKLDFHKKSVFSYIYKNKTRSEFLLKKLILSHHGNLNLNF